MVPFSHSHMYRRIPHHHERHDVCRQGAVTPGPSRECNMTFFVNSKRGNIGKPNGNSPQLKMAPKMAWKLRINGNFLENPFSGHYGATFAPVQLGLFSIWFSTFSSFPASGRFSFHTGRHDPNTVGSCCKAAGAVLISLGLPNKRDWHF